MKLHIEPLASARGVVMACTGEWSLGDELVRELALWRLLRQELLQYAYAGRPACLVAVDPGVWSLVRDLTRERPRAIGGARYLTAKVDVCDPGLLERVAAAEDFEGGLLWLTALDGSPARLRALARAVQTAEMPTTPEELVLAEHEGTEVHWLNPGRAIAPLVERLRELAGIGEWHVRDAV